MQGADSAAQPGLAVADGRVPGAAGLVTAPGQEGGSRAQSEDVLGELPEEISEERAASPLSWPFSHSNDMLLLHLHFYSWTRNCTGFRLDICLSPGTLGGRGRCQGSSLSSEMLRLRLVG